MLSHGVPGRIRAMSRVMKLLALAILTAAFALTGSACEDLHYDMYLGTDAGAGFDAPAREVSTDGAPDDAGAGAADTGGVIVDAGDQADGGASAAAAAD
jgi:hypothetical protein